MAKWGHHTKKFKAQAVERMKSCGNVKALAAELQVSRAMLYEWKYEVEGTRPKQQSKRAPSPGSSAYNELQKENVDLKIALADKTLEASFFKGALQRVEERRRKHESGGGAESTTTLPK